MMIPFTKMHGLGNDFVILDTITHPEISLSGELAQKLGDRHFGVGCDQILVIERSEVEDFRYRIYNQDGSEVEMCGNGARCFFQYVRERGLTEKHEVRVETMRGVIVLRTDGQDICVDMGPPILEDELIPVKKGIREIAVAGRDFSFVPVSMGNPHAVIFQSELISDLDIAKYGRSIEISTEIFPKRVNIEFINILSPTHIDMRVWERGAGETLACGTGACAAVVAGIIGGYLEKDIPIRVSLKGGNLSISWSGKDNEGVMMGGPAVEVFRGEFIVR